MTTYSKSPSRLWEKDYLKKVIEPANIEAKVRELKSKNLTICTVNGSFDLMHAGHLQMLYEPSFLADILIVALNSDESVKKYKSSDKPIIPLKYRLEMVAALEFVDFVTWFDEVDPRVLLSRIKPDWHANGAEYGENCVERETLDSFGGKLYLVKRIDGLSTSSIIEKIKKCVT